MNEKDFNEQEYLKACLIRDMLNAKGMVATYVNITEVMKKEKEKLQQEVEDWKYKCGKMDDEMCELKKENLRLRETSDSWKEIYESNKLLDEKVESLQIKKEELELKIKDLEQELLKKVIVECEPKVKGKPGREPGVKK